MLLWFVQGHEDGNFGRAGIWAIESPSTSASNQSVISGK